MGFKKTHEHNHKFGVPPLHANIQSCVWSKDNLIQNSPAVKKECGPQKAMVKKDVKSKVAAKKWL